VAPPRRRRSRSSGKPVHERACCFKPAEERLMASISSIAILGGGGGEVTLRYSRRTAGVNLYSRPIAVAGQYAGDCPPLRLNTRQRDHEMETVAQRAGVRLD
jgi:hypothetical protein